MKKFLIGAVLGVSSLGVLAGTTWVGNAHAASSESVAMQLSRLVMTKETYEAMIKQMMEGMIKATGQTPSSKDFKELQAVMLEVLPYDEMLEFNAKVYSKRFKDSELQDIMTFYKTPTGAKLVKVMPDISGDVGALVGKIIPERLPAVLKKHGIGK